MKRVFLLSIAVILSLVQVRAQLNIVENGSFEIYSSCPNGYSTLFPQIIYAYGWRQPTAGTCDYFNSCAPPLNDAGVPRNFFGRQPAKTGNAYAGLFAFLDQTVFMPNLSREYIQTRTTRPLKADRNYYFEMFVSLADKPGYRYTVNNIGACLTPDDIRRPDADAFQYPPQVVSSRFLDDTSGWMKISGVFTAKGGEQFLTIGRFGPNDAAAVSNLPGDRNNLYSYYYIDDVKLIDSCAELDDLTTGILGKDSDFCALGPLFKVLDANNNKTKSFEWSTGQTTSSIIVTTPGTYWVKMMNGTCMNADTVIISNTPKPDISLGNDTAICFGREIKLFPATQDPGFVYNWNIDTGGIVRHAGSAPTLNITWGGKVMLEVRYSSCRVYDTLEVFKSKLEQVKLPHDTLICRHTILPLNAATPGAVLYKWNTGQTDPVIMASAHPLYWAEISDGLCKSRDTILLSFKGSLPASLDTSFCSGSSLLLESDPSATSVSWSTGATTPTITISDSGLYIVSQVKDGCTTSDSITVRTDPIPEIELGPDITICEDAMTTLLAWTPAATRYKWSTGDTDPFLVVTDTGRYSVILYNASCIFTDSVTVFRQLREPVDLGHDTAVCFNKPMTLYVTGGDSYLWNTGSSDSAIQAQQAGIYWVTVAKGVCEHTDTITLSQHPLPFADLGNDTTLCFLDSIILNAHNPGSTYLWNTGSVNRQLMISDSGVYSVRITNIYGCYATDSIRISTFPQFPLFPDYTGILCKDSSYTIVADPGMAAYRWENGSSADHLVVNTPGTYRLSISDIYGCTYTDSIHIIEKPRPEVITERLYELCEPDFVATTTIPYKTYLWSDGSTSPAFHIRSYGMYALTVSDSNNCTNTVTVQVARKCIPSVYVPNVFSPNNDGINDRIIPSYNYIVKTHFTIYNRWGQMVFSTDNTEQSWDGQTVAGSADAGVYYYVLKCTGNEEQQFEQTGTITLVR
jgi:gliding motility-associated-like protein